MSTTLTARSGCLDPRTLSIALVTLLVALSFPAKSQTISIPVPGKVNSVQKPASDLMDPKTGKVLDVGEAAGLAERGVDLSIYDPVINKMWQKKSLSLSNADQLGYPSAARGVRFQTMEATTRYTILARVQSNENPNLYFRIGISRLTQPVMMRAALLRKLGYDIPSPKFYSNLTLRFDSEEQKEQFLSEAQQSVGDFESRGWILENRTQDHALVLASSSLEVVSSDYFDLHWGMAPNPDFPDQLPLVQRFSRNRAYRALIFPYALVDVPESVNRFSAQFGMVTTGNIIVTYPMATSFAACTYADARWILRRLQTLTLADFQGIIAEAHYPKEIEPLVLAKLIARAKDALNLFSLNIPASWPSLPLDITSESGLVAKGKVTQEFVKGYPQRFAHGDRSSPYQEGDFGRYLKVGAISSAIKTVLDHLNEQLQVSTMSDVAQKYQEEKFNSLIARIKANPRQPIYQEVTSWGGPLAGVNFNASRHVATGTYYGSTASVQLVDNVSVSAGLGYFRALDGLSYLPLAGANVAITRDYTHVRPILTITEGSKVSWKNLLVPHFMWKLTGVLKTEKTKKDDSSEQNSLDAFLQELRDGEVFTVTDSVALGAYLQASASLDMLLGITPFNFLNSVTLGVDGSRVILRQTQFVKTPNGVQVFVRQMKNRGTGIEMNVNFFLNLLKIRSQITKADVDSDGFVIEYSPELAADIDDPEAPKAKEIIKTRDNLRLVLLPLLRENDTELLYSKFRNKMFRIEHDFKTAETKARFIAYRYAAFREEHLLNLQYPRSDKHPELDPKDEMVTLYGYKRGELVGRDLLGMFFDFVDGILNFKKVKGDISRPAGDNPANVPYGRAKWRIVNSEADLSANIEQQKSVAMVQHVWGGWRVKRDQFLKTIDSIEADFKRVKLVSYPIINRDNFIQMKSLDFYRITQNLSVLEGGLAKIRDLITQPDADGKPADTKGKVLRFFQRISTKLGHGPKANDKEMFEDILRILGNGDLNEGYAIYNQSCKAEHNNGRNDGEGGSNQASTNAYYYGTYYDCLTSWMQELIRLSRKYPVNNKKGQTKWLVDVLRILDDKIPMPQLLQYLGEENYVFVIRVNGFRAGDEDGDLEFFSSTAGDPKEEIDYANGLFQLYAKKTRILPTELDRTIGGFQ
jgi:hypothetical protein